MSDENVQIVVDALEAWSAGDLDRTLSTIDPDVVWTTTGLIPDVSVEYRGHEGVLKFWHAWRDVWEELKMVPQRVIDAGESVVVAGMFEGTGRDGVKVSQPFAQVYTLRDGKLVRFQGCASMDDALREAGLDPAAVARG